MSSIDTGIDDIGTNAGASGIIVGVSRNTTVLVRDTADAPSSTGLSYKGINSGNAIVLDVLNL